MAKMAFKNENGGQRCDNQQNNGNATINEIMTFRTERRQSMIREDLTGFAAIDSKRWLPKVLLG
jgi:hypothetical protein